MNDKAVDTDIDWDNVIKAYYLEKRTVASIVEEYKLPVSQAIYEIFPPYIHDDLVCEYCGGIKLQSSYTHKSASRFRVEPDLNIKAHETVAHDMSQRSPNRRHNNTSLSHSGYALSTEEGYRITYPACPQCHHKPHKECICENCVTVRENNKAEIARQLKKQLDRETPDFPDYDDLPCEDLLYAISATQYGAYQDKERYSLHMLNEEQRERLLASGIFIPDMEALESAVKMLSVYDYEIHTKDIPFRINAPEKHDQSSIPDELKQIAAMRFFDQKWLLQILEVWMKIALSEALSFLHEYAMTRKVYCHPAPDELISTVKRSLHRYGLSATATYIEKTIDYVNKKKDMEYLSQKKTMDEVYQSLNYWVDSEKARSWNVRFLTRHNPYLKEPRAAIAFSHAFLEVHNIDYFTAAINTTISPAEFERIE